MLDKPGTRQARRIDDIRAQLDELVEGGPPALDAFLPELAALVDADKGFALGFDALPGADLSLDFAHAHGFAGEPFADDVDALLRRKPVGWTNWDPLKPERAQRNRAIAVIELLGRRKLEAQPIYREVLSRHALTGRDQLRVLVCDGSALLAWVGVLRAEPFGSGERQLYQSMVPALQRRLRVERHLERAPLAQGRLAAALDAIPAPAFVLGPGAQIRLANAAGRDVLDRDPRQTREALRAALRAAGDATYTITPVLMRGGPREWIAVMRGAPADPVARGAVLARRWTLTRRQTEVLIALARGMANKTIAVALGIAEGTVELHVTALLAKLECESRAELVAKFWSEPL